MGQWEFNLPIIPVHPWHFCALDAKCGCAHGHGRTHALHYILRPFWSQNTVKYRVMPDAIEKHLRVKLLGLYMQKEGWNCLIYYQFCRPH